MALILSDTCPHLTFAELIGNVPTKRHANPAGKQKGIMMSQEKVPNPASNEKVVTSVRVHQQKSALFRVVHSDGVWCSINAWGNVHLTFYSERAPIPTSVYFALDEKGAVTREEVEKREVKEGWFRELEVDIVLTRAGARSVYDVLSNYLKAMGEKIEGTEE